MAVVKYKKFQILLHADTKKTQGLQTGDIVRRQYFDGDNRIVYSLMCVLDYGYEKVINPSTGEEERRAYFTGALLEGDEPKSNELLDFARVTNLFNANRSGALYLTSNDSDSPFMDVIDKIGKTDSLCWPEGIVRTEQSSPQSQYVVVNPANFNIDYSSAEQSNSRILRVTRTHNKIAAFEGLQQDFFKYIKNPDRVLISYKARASKPISVNMNIGYTDNQEIDGVWNERFTQNWEYKLHAITIEHSGNHLRSFKMDFQSLEMGEDIEISDFNIILLSSLSDFNEFSRARIGKLNGIHDSVFGTLEGYGVYLQKLYASQATHVSGTLTAGDENGFGATFYAGKIHRNAFVNSLDVNMILPAVVDNDAVGNPTGIGNVYRCEEYIKMKAQSADWARKHVGERFCFSFWHYLKQSAVLEIIQNGQTVGYLRNESDSIHQWRRSHIELDIAKLDPQEKDYVIEINVYYVQPLAEDAFVDSDIDRPIVYITAPQLEAGNNVTQYQPTDSVLNYDAGYGAWFAKGGIGGTIQNPLLRFNDDGSIASKDGSFVIRNDGTGYFAGKRFEWTKENIIFRDLKIKWEDLAPDAQDEVKSKSINIVGPSTFVYDRDICTPESICLSLHANNFEPSLNDIAWYCQDVNEAFHLLGTGVDSITIYPSEKYWQGRSLLLVKCVVKFNQTELVDTITIQKTRNGEDSYSLKIYATNGNTFKNGIGSTELVAHVFRGGEEITDTLFAKDFDWIKTSSNPDTDRIFNESHKGWGNRLFLTSDDVWNMAQFDCRVRIN